MTASTVRKWIIRCLWIVFLVACGPPPPKETATAVPTLVPLPTANITSPITLTVAARSGPIATGLKAVVADWEQATGHQVEILEYPYAYLQEQIFTDILTSKGQYDVVLIDDPWFQPWAGGEYLVPLTQFGYHPDADFIKLSLDVSSWPPPHPPLPPDTNAGQQSQLYALPLVGNVQLFWYRKDLLPRQPTSLTDWMTMVRETADPSNQLYGYTYRNGWGNPIVTEFNAWNWSYGGDIFDEDWHVIINQPKSVQALTDFIAFTQTVAPGQGYGTTDSMLKVLLEGQALSAVMWPSDNLVLNGEAGANLSGKLGIIPFPGGERQTSQLGNWLLGIPITADHKDAAFDFIVWATNPETMTKLAQFGLPPTRSSVFQDPALVQEFFWFPATEQALTNATWRPRTPEWGKVEHILGKYLVLAVNGEMAPQNALDGAALEIQSLMTESGYIN